MYSTSIKKLLSLLTVFAMVFSMIAMVQPMQASAATVDVAISNGDFENGAFGGAVSGNSGATIVSNENVHSGNYAAYLSKDNGSTMTLTVYPTAEAQDRTFTLKFWMKVDPTAPTNSVHTCINTAMSDWTSQAQVYGAQYAAIDGNWYEKTVSVNVPANKGIVQVQLYSADPGTATYIDDISLLDTNGNELLTNGGLENGNLYGSISTQSGVTLISTPVHGGSYAAHADKAGGGNISTTVSIEASSEAREMTLSYWLYVTPGATNSAHNGVFCYDTVSNSPNWTLLTQKYGAQYATPGVWTQMSLPVAVAANTDTIQIQIYAQDDGADFYIDDLKLTEEVEDVAVNHEAVIGLNQVTSDGTWQMSLTSATQIPATYYKIPVTIDGAACNILAQYNGEILIVYPNFFPALGGAVPTSQIIIAEGAVLKAVDSANGWAEVDGAATVTVTQALDLSYVDGAWSKTVYTTDVDLSLNQVTGDGTWQFSISEAPANKYYKVPATIDGVACEFLMGESGGIMCVYPNFFTAIGGAVPTESIIIAKGAVLKAVDPNNFWAEIADANTLTLNNAIDLSYVNGVWSKTVYTTNVEISFNQVTSDGTWQFGFTPAPAERFYKVSAIVDGTACNVLVGESGGIMCVYPNFFTAIGGAVPAESLVIPAGTVMYAVDSTNGWQVIDGANTLTTTNSLNVEYNLGSWQDMSQYADVTFEEITADDLIVYKWEDQAESNYRSVLGIYVPNAQFGNDANWGNFVKVAGKVLIDGVEVSVVYGMAPGADDDSSWGANNAILLYITGEGYWDAVTTASSVTVCAGTMLVSGVDNTKGVQFAEDFTMYKNCDGSWDTTADTHVYNQQNTEMEGAQATAANCQNAATYYYSCVCGELSSETFASGELGNHNYVNGSCTVCGKAAQNITVSLHAIAVDGTWQFDFSAAPAKFYKIPAIIDGKACNVLIGEDQGLMCIYPNFFTALGGAVPAESFVIPAGTALKAVDSENSWAEIEDAAVLLVTEELKIENIAGKWVEMSKYANVTFTEIYAADLDLYYQNIMRLGDYSDIEIAMAKLEYPEIADLIEIYGDDANMTTFGIYSTIPTLQIPNDANWSNFQLLGTISVAGATAAETYVMMTPDSSDDAETAMTSGFLVRFYNGFVADVATSVTIEPGTRIVTKDGTAGFVFVDGYTIYRDENGNWSDTVPEGVNPVNKWGLILGDNIGVQFQMNVNPEDVVTFTVNGAAVTPEQSGSIYTIYVAAAQMTDDIVISINGEALEKTYSVRAYADIILAGSYGENTKNLVKQMLNYGAAAQTFFQHNDGNLANADIEVTAPVPSGDGEIVTSGEVDGIYFYGASLVHRNKTAVRIYFVADSVEDLSFTVNGESCNAELRNGMYCVELAGINPQDMGNDVTVVVSDGTDSLSVAYSPLDYIVRMYNKTDSSNATKALVQALYGYYQAAVTYMA